MIYEAYTDGACNPNPGNGGWAYVLVQGNKIQYYDSGCEASTTNNRMEYLAMIACLEKHGSLIKIVHTDSMLLVDTCNDWRHKWKAKGWTRVKKGKNSSKEIKNLDLVLRLDSLLELHNHIQVKWVKGHNGHPFNEAADELAENAYRTFHDNPYFVI